MQGSYINKLSLDPNGFSIGQGFAKGHIQKNAFAQSQGTSFSDVLNNTVGSVNKVMNSPDTMMQESIVNGTYDIHEVMLASAKAELAVTITSQVATKVIQAYDRILQIQI